MTPSEPSVPAPRRPRAPRKAAAPPPVPDEPVDRGGAWCVVGAGPHGLSALKALLQHGIDADGF